MLPVLFPRSRTWEAFRANSNCVDFFPTSFQRCRNLSGFSPETFRCAWTLLDSLDTPRRDGRCGGGRGGGGSKWRFFLKFPSHFVKSGMGKGRKKRGSDFLWNYRDAFAMLCIYFETFGIFIKIMGGGTIQMCRGSATLPILSWNLWKRCEIAAARSEFPDIPLITTAASLATNKV